MKNQAHPPSKPANPAPGLRWPILTGTRLGLLLRRMGLAAELGYCGMLLLLVFGDRVLNRAPVWILVPKTFLPYLFLPLLALGLYAALRRTLKRHAPSLMLGCLLFVALYGRQLFPGLHDVTDTAISVMSYNVQRELHGTPALLQTIGAERPKVLALQEVRQPDESRSHLIPVLQDVVGYTCEYRSYFTSDTTAGMAVCVLPPLSLANVQRRTYHKDGQWSYLFAELQVGQRTINIVAPHLLAFRISDKDPKKHPRYTWRRLSWATRWHHQETNELLRLIKELHDPTIIAGDFNSTPEQLIHHKIRRTLTDTFRSKGFGFGATYRFVVPLRIDYVYVTAEIRALSCRVGAVGSSDHRPVVALIDLEK